MLVDSGNAVSSVDWFGFFVFIYFWHGLGGIPHQNAGRRGRELQSAVPGARAVQQVSVHPRVTGKCTHNRHSFPAAPHSSSEFDRCLELLQELETRGESSGPVLRHNRAVVSYYKTGCTQHSVLLKELEALTADADAPGDVSSGLSLKQGAAAATVARYNRAVIYYHRHMFGTALEKLAPLVARLEALEKAMAALVATLQLQLLLATNQLNRAEAFLDYLQYKLNLVATAPSSNAAEEAAVVGTAPPSAATNSSVVASPGGAAVEGAVPGLGGSLQLLQLITLVLNRKPVVIQEDGTPEYAALKAQQYYIMKDFQMAAKQLMRINNECTQAG